MIGRETYANSKTPWSVPLLWSLAARFPCECYRIGLQATPGTPQRQGLLWRFFQPKDSILKRKSPTLNDSICKPRWPRRAESVLALPNFSKSAIVPSVIMQKNITSEEHNSSCLRRTIDQCDGLRPSLWTKSVDEKGHGPFWDTKHLHPNAPVSCKCFCFIQMRNQERIPHTATRLACRLHISPACSGTIRILKEIE